MEASFRDRSSRMDASGVSQQERRRTLKSTGSGRRRRPPSVERMPDHSVVDASSRMDSSTYSKSSRARMDSSSTLAGSRRRVSGQTGTTGTAGMADVATKSHSHAQKYRAAQALLDEQQQQQQKMTHQKLRHVRRQSSVGGSSGMGGKASGERGSPSPKSRGSSPKTTGGKVKPVSDKYKSISRAAAGARRKSMDSSATMESNNDASVRSHNISTSANSAERRARSVARHLSSRGTVEKSHSTTRSKKVLSADSTPSTQARVASKSPARGVRRQSSLPISNAKAPGPRRMGERKAIVGSRRSVLPSSGSGSEDGQPHRRVERKSSGMGRMRSDRRCSLPSTGFGREGGALRKQQGLLNLLPKDLASQNSKPEEQDSMDSSMPSLAALDLSIHAGGKKLVSEGSGISLSTASRTVASDDKSKPFQLPTALSVQVDNAQSHAPTRAQKHGDLDEASTICSSVGDIYQSAASVDTTDPTQYVKNDQISRMDLSRSDGSTSLGTLRMESSSQTSSSSRRRTQSHEDNANAVQRRKQSSRSRSKGASKPRGESKSRGESKPRGDGKSNGSTSNRNLRARSTSSERRPRRRSSVAGHDPREERAAKTRNSSSTLRQETDIREIGNRSNPSLQRRHTTEQLPRGHKSSSSLQKLQAAEPPRRLQRSMSSLRSVGSKASTAPKRKSQEEAPSRPVISKSLSNLNASWMLGSANTEMDKGAAATGGKKGNKQPNTKSSAASVGSNSLESRSSRRSWSSRKGGPPSRSMSSGSASLASSQGSGSSRKKERMRRSLSMKPARENKGSDNTPSRAGKNVRGDSKTDASVLTQPTVSSSSVEHDTPRIRNTGLRRSLSTGSTLSYGFDKSRRQPSQKNLLSTGSKKEIREVPNGFPGAVPLSRGKSTDRFHRSADQLDVFKTSGKKAKARKSAANADPVKTHNKGRLNSLQGVAGDADAVENYQDDKQTTDADPFGSSLLEPFASSDPFGLGKPDRDPTGLAKHARVKKGHVPGQPKPNDDWDKDSFHMTNDFGDFGHESFGSVNFDNSSQDFAVVISEKASAKSLLG